MKSIFCFHLVSNLAWNSSSSCVFASSFLLLSNRICFACITVSEMFPLLTWGKWQWNSGLTGLSLRDHGGYFSILCTTWIPGINQSNLWNTRVSRVYLYVLFEIRAYVFARPRKVRLNCSKRGFWRQWFLKSSALKKKKLPEGGLAL